jgi:hypothetical protein
MIDQLEGLIDVRKKIETGIRVTKKDRIDAKYILLLSEV